MSVRQAIQTRFVPIGDRVKFNRVIAWCEAGRKYYEWIDGIGIEGNHRRAAELLALQLKWTNALIGGRIYNRDFVWVQT